MELEFHGDVYSTNVEFADAVVYIYVLQPEFDDVEVEDISEFFESNSDAQMVTGLLLDWPDVKPKKFKKKYFEEAFSRLRNSDYKKEFFRIRKIDQRHEMGYKDFMAMEG